VNHGPEVTGYNGVQKLGEGGMGIVYLLRHRTTGEQIVFKVIRPGTGLSPSAQVLFMREMDSMASLSHPHVVRMLPGVTALGTIGFAMEFCEAGDLAMYVKSNGGSLKEAEAKRLCLEMLNGLDYCHHASIQKVTLADGATEHAVGVVHRDFKPQNVLLVPGPNGPLAKVADFGLSKAFEWAGLTGMTATGDVCGTFEFMPRKQLIDYKYAKPEVDVWAAAATLYYMLSGELVRDFGGAPAEQVVMTMPIVPLEGRSRAKGMSPELVALVNEALDESAHLRFQSARAFAHALEKLAGS
jgi:serine/threonine protein kinase